MSENPIKMMVSQIQRFFFPKEVNAIWLCQISAWGVVDSVPPLSTTTWNPLLLKSFLKTPYPNKDFNFLVGNPSTCREY